MAATPSVSPRRIISAVEEPTEEDKYGVSEATWDELQKTIAVESKAFRTSGKLKDTPQKDNTVAPEANKTSTEVKKQKFLINLRIYFDVLGFTDSIPPEQYSALSLLQQVANERDPRVTWICESEIDKRIRLRNEEVDRMQAERKRRTEELRQELIPKPTTYERFIEHYTESMNDIRLGEQKDKTVLEEMDRAKERQERLLERQTKERKEYGQQKIEEARKQREARHEERMKQLEALKDQEEDLRDDLLAVARVKKRWEDAKPKIKAGDLAKLENY